MLVCIFFYRTVLMVFYITWWSLRPIIISNLISLGFLGFGMLIYLMGLNGYFFVHCRFAVCSNHLQLMPWKKGFPSPPPPQERLLFIISFWVHVFEFGFDMFIRCYERMWVNYYVGDILRFFVHITFQFSNPIGHSLNSNKKSKTFFIFSSIHHQTNEVSFVSSYGGSTRTV